MIRVHLILPELECSLVAALAVNVSDLHTLFVEALFWMRGLETRSFTGETLVPFCSTVY